MSLSMRGYVDLLWPTGLRGLSRLLLLCGLLGVLSLTESSEPGGMAGPAAGGTKLTSPPPRPSRLTGSTSVSRKGRRSPRRMRASEAMWSTQRDGMRSTVSRYSVPVVTSSEHAMARFMPPSEPPIRSAVGGRMAWKSVAVMLNVSTNVNTYTESVFSGVFWAAAYGNRRSCQSNAG